MKTLLICPSQTSGVPLLVDSRAAAALPILGEHFICYWMTHLAQQGFREVRIVTMDPVEEIEYFVGDGSRWGIQVQVHHADRDLNPDEARQRHGGTGEEGWPAAPGDLIEADHLPGMPDKKLFASYRSFYESLEQWLPQAVLSHRIGLRELTPGVWVGRKTHIDRSAKLHAPCFIGDNVRIGKNAVVGPRSYLEERVVLDQNCEVSQSWIAPETFVGALTQVKESLAWGNLLINWRSDSHIVVPDSFLMSSMSEEKPRGAKVKRGAGAKPATASQPFAPVISLAQKAQG